MGTYNLGLDDVKPYLLKAIKEASNEESGDVSAESIAEAYNELSKRFMWGDRLCAMEKCLTCNRYYPIIEKSDKNTYYPDEQCKKCRDKAKLKEEEDENY